MRQQHEVRPGHCDPANDIHESDAIFAHLDLEKFEAYRRSELSAEETEHFREHVMGCEICRDYLGFLAMEVEEESSGALDFEKEGAWLRLRARRLDEREARLSARAAQAAQTAGALSRMVPWAWAAVLFLVLPIGGNVYQMFKNIELTRQQTVYLEPQMNVQVFDLAKGDSRGADEGSAIEIELAPNLHHFTASFPVDDPAAIPGAMYRVEITDADGETLWEGEGLKTEFGYASLGLSRYFLGEGTYHLEVFRSGTDDLVVRHELRLSSRS